MKKPLDINEITELIKIVSPYKLKKFLRLNDEQKANAVFGINRHIIKCAALNDASLKYDVRAINEIIEDANVNYFIAVENQIAVNQTDYSQFEDVVAAVAFSSKETHGRIAPKRRKI